MRGADRIAAIIPVLNEAASLALLLPEMPEWVDEIIVVDNGSSDGSAAVAQTLGARVAHAPLRGYGSACAAGVAASTADILVFLDGDGSDRPDQMERLIAPVVAGTADLVIGSRVLGTREAGSLTLQQRLGNALACWLMRWLWRARYTDLGPYRVIRRDALARLDLRNRRFGWTVEMQIRAHRQGMTVIEVPVDYRRRLRGVSKISGTMRGVVLAGWHILGTIAIELGRRD